MQKESKQFINLNFTIMKIKNNFQFFTILLVFLSTTTVVVAQSKAEKKALKKEVKQLTKDGWKTNPGYLTLGEQISQSKAVLKDQEQWVIGEAKSIGTVYDAVRSNALYQAKVNLATNIQTRIGGTGGGGTGNDQGGENSVSATRFREVAKTKFAADIKRPKILMDCYRDLKDGKIEVNIRIAMAWNEAELSYQEMIKELKEMVNK